MKTKKYRELTEKYTLSQKKTISKRIFQYSLDEVKTDYQKLCEIGCLAKERANSLIGNKVSDYHTFFERLNTHGNKQLNFYEIWKNRAFFKEKKYVKNFIKVESKNHPDYTTEHIWYSLARFYFGSIQQFKPLIAMKYFCEYKPTAVLDPTCGWFGRGIACSAIGVSKYIAFDTNRHLGKPYKEIVDFLKREGSTTEFQVEIQDALTVDYSKYEYDMVFTSPPYYNVEMYHDQSSKTEDEWNAEFYRPLVEKTYGGLKRGGHFILIVPEKVYTSVLNPILGKYDKRELLIKSNKKRSSKVREKTVSANREYVYIWRKP